MNPRWQMLAGGTLGALWALGVVWLGVTQIEIPVFALLPTLASAFLGPGLVIAGLVLLVSLRRFFDDGLADGDEPLPFSPADIDVRALRNTVEQTVIALCLWPAAAYLATDTGPGLVMALGVAFVPARLAYWVGYRVSPPLRLFGFAATFYATLFALLWATVSAVDFAQGLAGG